jgi:dinuclear metal center YbgI/SA1388 family protein
VAATSRVSDVLAALAERAPFAKAAAWDPVGLQLGDPDASVRRLAVCHEVTEDVVAAVEHEPPDLLVAYHPLLFRATHRLVAGRTPEGRALRLISAGVALVVVHTSFDVARGGVADALAEVLELENPRGFAPLHGPEVRKAVTFLPASAADRVLDAVAAAGAGRIGAYTHCSFRSEGTGTFFAAAGTQPVVGQRGELNREPELRIEFVVPAAREAAVLAALVAAHPYEEPAYDLYERRGDAGLLGRVGTLPPGTQLGDLVETVASALGSGGVRVAGDRARVVERAAVIPGSGSDFLDAAADAGADVVITGDVTHHAARAALDRGLALIDPGHAPTERPGLERLLAHLASLGGPACASLLDVEVDPWQS